MEPLASLIRPKNLEEFVGQKDLVGPGKPLRIAIEEKHLFSFILWGPPGSGKTTLARIYARALGAEFHEISAVDSGKDDIKRIVGKRGTRGLYPIILFIDEIHRFNKAQQDFLLPYVEDGTLTLIGATTENPSFEVISALLSRCRVFVLHELSQSDMEEIIDRTKLKVPKDARRFLIEVAAGDARQVITALENADKLYGKITIETLTHALQSPIRYDKKGEEHYNTISAFIKSMRASQTDAALYYLARMVAAGEDPKFIARRMVIFASEDIGLAAPTALVVANAVFQAVTTIGYPECTINLAHGVAYLCRAPKDRSSYEALGRAQADAETYGALPIPMRVRNAPTQLMRDLGYHKGYKKYDTESYLPDKLKDKKYFIKSIPKEAGLSKKKKRKDLD